MNRERVLRYRGCENFRQLGGYPVAGGRQVKWGMFYRCGRLCGLSAAGEIEAFEKLGVRHIFDFRSGGERQAMPDPPLSAQCHQLPALLSADKKEVNFDLSELVKGGYAKVRQMGRFVEEGYRHMPFGSAAYAEMFRVLLAGEAPILFHCTAGKDRTGVAAALILLALGASEKTAVEDYLLTNRFRLQAIQGIYAELPHLRRSVTARLVIPRIAGVRRSSIKAALSAILERYDSYENYFLQEYAMGPLQLQKLRELYTQ